MPDFSDEKFIEELIQWGFSKGYTDPVGTLMHRPPLDADHLQTDELRPTGPVRSHVPDWRDAIGDICEHCPNQYSLTFQILDVDNQPCVGMYYTIMCGVLPTDKNIHRGITGKDGMTAPEFSSVAGTVFYLYLGHRTDEDGYPSIRSIPKAKDAKDVPENEYDEAPLWHGKVQEYRKRYVCQAKTKRKWKPWTATQKAENFTSAQEGLVENEYDADSKTTKNVTVGIGNLVHSGAFVMNQKRVDLVTGYLRANNMPITVQNIQNNLGAATGLTGHELAHAQAEMQYPNGLTEDEAKNLFSENVYPKHSKLVEPAIHVPLYQNEYDALVDIMFNRTTVAISSEGYNRSHHKINPGGSYATWLNRGRYYYTGDNRVPQLARGSIGNRRDGESKLFLNDDYGKRKIAISKYKFNNKTPWNPIDLDE